MKIPSVGTGTTVSQLKCSIEKFCHLALSICSVFFRTNNLVTSGCLNWESGTLKIQERRESEESKDPLSVHMSHNFAELCSHSCCHHNGTPLSLDYFRKGESMPHCYYVAVLYSQWQNAGCSVSRLQKSKSNHHLTMYFRPLPLSLVHAQRKRCTKYHRNWSLI